MRIISGDFKGKKIHPPEDNVTRPLKDLTKESIFNIIKHSKLLKLNLEKSSVLDLFAGVGSFGLECLSRNANSVIFFENYSNATRILKRNIENINKEGNTKIIEDDIFISTALINLKQKFDIIFMDPPYKEKEVSKLLEKIIELDLLTKNGTIIIHRNKNEKDIFPSQFNILIERTYGVSNIIFGNYN